MIGNHEISIVPETFVPAPKLPIGQLLRRLRSEANPDGLNFSQTAALALFEENGGMITAFDAHLQAYGITQIMNAGIATSNCVDTARQAYMLGLDFAFPIDVMTDGNADAGTHSVTQVFSKIGETGTTEEIIALLKRSA